MQSCSAAIQSTPSWMREYSPSFSNLLEQVFQEKLNLPRRVICGHGHDPAKGWRADIVISIIHAWVTKAGSIGQVEEFRPGEVKHNDRTDATDSLAMRKFHWDLLSYCCPEAAT